MRESRSAGIGKALAILPFISVERSIGESLLRELNIDVCEQKTNSVSDFRRVLWLPPVRGGLFFAQKSIPTSSVTIYNKAMKAYLSEVEKRITSLQPPKKPSPWKAEDYIGGGQSSLRYTNAKIPDVRSSSRQGFSFSDLEGEEQWQIWNYIWQNSNIFEVMLLALHWAAKRPVEDLHKNRKVLLSWLDRVDNWAHSDELSGLYSKLLEHSPDTYLEIFKKWNRSEKPWFKRQSMVGLFFYSRFRESYVPYKTAIEFVKAHLHDEHYYVQKGVGWTLRELWNVYPKETYVFLTEHAAEIHPGAWTAATEKLSVPDKNRLKKIRKEKRTHG